MSSTRLTTLKRLLLASVLYFICLGLGVLCNRFFDHAGNMVYAPAFSALFASLLYYGFLLPQKRFGFITVVAFLNSLFFLGSRHFWGAPITYIVAGLIADLLAYSGAYQDKWRSILSYIVFAFASSGPIIFMWLTPKAYAAALLARGKSQAYVDKVMLAADLKTILVFVISLMLTAIIASLLASAVFKRLQKKY